MMQLVVDCRERALIEHFPTASVKQLVLGDFAIEQDGKEVVIVERKTVADFAASISDGRYREQSERLMAYDIPNHNVIYLIEGSLKYYKHKIPKATLLAAITSLLYGKGFSVVRTESVEDTADFVRALLAKLQKEKGFAEPKVGGSSVRKQKRDKITPETIDAIMLSQIPSVSATTAAAILKVYPTVFELITALKADPTCLDAVRVGSRLLARSTIEKLKCLLVK
jgi:ERCC4-type nuclease